MGLVFVALPLLAAKAGDKWQGGIGSLLVPSILRTVLAVEFTAIILGSWKLCLPGIVVSIYALWLGATVVLASRRRWIYDPKSWAVGYSKFLLWAAQGHWREYFVARVIAIPQASLILSLILASASVQYLWYPLTNYRFQGIQSYARVVSLQTLVTGNAWSADGSVAFLAPVVFLSGLDAATVIRFSSPIFFTMLVAAAAWCAYQYSGATWCSIFTAGLCWLYTRTYGIDSTGEPGGLEISALFLVLAVGCLRRSPGYAVIAAILAWLTEPKYPTLLLSVLGCIFIAMLIHWVYSRSPRMLRQFAATAFLLGIGVSLNSALRSQPADGPYEYEASARIASRIARDFPRNRWVLVSPAHEAAYSFSRGWHVELTEFLRQFPASKLSNPHFQFPYESDNIFVFVEKRPLPQTGRMILPGSSGSSFFYSTMSGRASMEFDAARAMAAYSSAHSNSSVYFEDQDLIIYRIAK